MQSRILVVDDDTRLRELLESYLTENDFSVKSAKNAEEARALLGKDAFDLMVLDLMMPGESGLSLAKSLRASSQGEGGQIPILMLTAKADGEDRIAGLEAGADDYLTKPFEPRELILRLHRILDRAGRGAQEDSLIKMGSYIFDKNTQKLFKGKDVIHLTSLEQTLLAAFSEAPGKPLSRDQLAEAGGVCLSPRTVDVQMTRLRKKIEEDPKKPLYLQTVRHKGYVLRVDS